MPRRPLYAVAIVALVGLFAVWLGVAWWGVGLRDGSAEVQLPAIGGAFTLTATDGSTVTDRTYRGKIMLVYFGYTYCPDACPTALNEIAAALDELGPLAGRIQPLFITVDPQRDTRDVLKNYVTVFDARIIGLTGTPEQIAAAAQAYRVYYHRYETADAPDGYLMDHNSVVYVMNEEGRFVASFTHETPAAQMAERLRRLIATTS